MYISKPKGQDKSDFYLPLWNIPRKRLSIAMDLEILTAYEKLRLEYRWMYPEIFACRARFFESAAALLIREMRKKPAKARTLEEMEEELDGGD
jgi:hypothetical protein